jgi:hypothetical protein
MTPSTPVRELVFVPSFFVGLKNIELAVPSLSQRPRSLASDKLLTFFVGPNSARMWILLPRIGNLHAMTKEALIASDIRWNRLADVILRVQTKNAKTHK